MKQGGEFIKPAFIFLFLTTMFCLFRLLPIFTAIERIYHYDELNLGFIATEWLAGRVQSPWHMQFDSYGGESLVLGFFSIPFVKILGPTLLAVKIPPFLFALATFGLTVTFINRFFSLSKAVLTGLLMIFCHPAYVQLSLSGMTGHTEALFFAIAMLYFFYEAMECFSPGFTPGARKSRRGVAFFLCGLMGGIGFWFYNESIIVVLLCLSCWLILDRRTLANRFFLFFATGLAIGLIPWFLYNAQQEAKGAAFLTGSFETFLNLIRDWRTLLQKACRLLSAGIPFSFVHFPVFGIHERFLSSVYFALAYLPLLPFAAWKLLRIFKTGKDPEKILPFLLFPLVFLAFFIVSPFDIAYTIGYAGYRYLSPLHLFLIPLPALLLPPGKLKNILIPAILLVGILGQTSLFFKEPFGRAQSYSGNSYYQMGTTLRFCLWPRLSTMADIENELKKRDSLSSTFLLWGFVDAAMSDNDEALLAESSIHAPEVLPAFSGTSRSYLYEWKGNLLSGLDELRTASEPLNASEKSLLHKGFFEKRDGVSIESFTNCPNCFENLNPEDSLWARSALGKYFHTKLLARRIPNQHNSFWGDTRRSEIQGIKNEISALNFSADEGISVYRGIAMANFRTSWDSNILVDRSFQNLLDHVSPQNRQALFWGIGWVAHAMYREDRQRALNQIDTIPQDGKAEALKGFSAFEEIYSIQAIGRS